MKTPYRLPGNVAQGLEIRRRNSASFNPGRLGQRGQAEFSALSLP
jgi:hypothetical protein